MLEYLVLLPTTVIIQYKQKCSDSFETKKEYLQTIDLLINYCSSTKDSFGIK